MSEDNADTKRLNELLEKIRTALDKALETSSLGEVRELLVEIVEELREDQKVKPS